LGGGGYMSDNNDKSLAILFGSQTGNAEELAENTKKLADKAGLVSQVFDMDGLSATDLSSHKRLLIITSTWGEGEMPDNAIDLWESVCSTSPQLNGLHFSVCAIGDTSYDEFCQAGIDWDNKLHELGANRTTDLQLCDVDFEPEWQQWVDKAVPAMAAVVISSADPEPAAELEEEVQEITVAEPKVKEEKSAWSAKNPYFTNIVENYVLNGAGSKKETRHVVFELGDSGLDYKVGDALGVVPENPPHIVEELIEIQGWDRDYKVTTHNGERSLYDALKLDFEVHMASKKFVQSLSEKIISTGLKITVKFVSRTRGERKWNASEQELLPPELTANAPSEEPSEKLEHLTNDAKAMEDYLWTRDYVDILREFDAKYSPEEFLDLAARLKPRLYSIASSHDAHPGLVELTVGIVRFSYHGRDRGGLCTQFMADEIGTSTKQVGVFMSPTKSFVLPEDKDIDIIMVGPGTGIAPFRAFMEQRVFDGGKGRNWLFFGDQSSKTEFYYKDTIESWLDSGDLYRFTTAWSRDQAEKIYVQHRLKEHGAEVWEWFENGAYFYICGDKTYMAKDVHRALIEIAIEHGGMSEADATHFIEKTMMKEQKRYLRDVY
tara:strand:- start:929 stop:2743 length:1815 start_codon:yes stop_codon:yes gene_type:complete